MFAALSLTAASFTFLAVTSDNLTQIVVACIGAAGAVAAAREARGHRHRLEHLEDELHRRRVVITKPTETSPSLVLDEEDPEDEV